MRTHQKHIKAANLISRKSGAEDAQNIVTLLNQSFDQVRQGAVPLTIANLKWETNPTEGQNIAKITITPSYAVTGAPPSYYLKFIKGKESIGYCVQAPAHMAKTPPAWYAELWQAIHTRPRLRDVQAADLDKAAAFIQSLL